MGKYGCLSSKCYQYDTTISPMILKTKQTQSKTKIVEQKFEKKRSKPFKP